MFLLFFQSIARRVFGIRGSVRHGALVVGSSRHIPVVRASVSASLATQATASTVLA